MTTSIYGLVCPISEELKYIGKSNSPERRMKDHLLDIRDMSVEKAKWVKKLKKRKLKPILIILDDEVEIEQWKYWESWWGEYFRGLGIILLNKHKGGNGLTYSNGQTFKTGNIPYNKGKKKINGIYI